MGTVTSSVPTRSVVPAPILGLLLDVDGPIASPVSRSIAIPSIATDLARLANAGIPIVFNTGRSDDFIQREVVPPLLAAGIDEGVTLYAVCEKGASWFTITRDGASEVAVDASLAVPEDYAREIETLVASKYEQYVFFDHTKRAMVSVEQRTDVSSADYLAIQPDFDADAIRAFVARDLGVVREGARFPDAANEIQWRVDPTIISTDIESVKLGKDLGAERAFALLEGTRPLPLEWRTVGDSRSDYAMADWLHQHGHAVSHVDVRPLDGIPEKPYAVLTAGDLIHDDAGAAFLERWAQMVRGEATDDDEVGIDEAA